MSSNNSNNYNKRTNSSNSNNYNTTHSRLSKKPRMNSQNSNNRNWNEFRNADVIGEGYWNFSTTPKWKRIYRPTNQRFSNNISKYFNDIPNKHKHDGTIHQLLADQEEVFREELWRKLIKYKPVLKEIRRNGLDLSFVVTSNIMQENEQNANNVQREMQRILNSYNYLRLHGRVIKRKSKKKPTRMSGSPTRVAGQSSSLNRVSSQPPRLNDLVIKIIHGHLSRNKLKPKEIKNLMEYVSFLPENKYKRLFNSAKIAMKNALKRSTAIINNISIAETFDPSFGNQ